MLHGVKAPTAVFTRCSYGAGNYNYGQWRTAGKDIAYKRNPVHSDLGYNRTAARLREVCDKYGWILSDNGGIIAEGQRTQFVTASRSCVKGFAKRAWERLMLGRDRRSQEINTRRTS